MCVSSDCFGFGLIPVFSEIIMVNNYFSSSLALQKFKGIQKTHSKHNGQLSIYFKN